MRDFTNERLGVKQHIAKSGPWTVIGCSTEEYPVALLSADRAPIGGLNEDDARALLTQMCESFNACRDALAAGDAQTGDWADNMEIAMGILRRAIYGEG
jgi:hypothetical protein